MKMRNKCDDNDEGDLTLIEANLRQHMAEN